MLYCASNENVCSELGVDHGTFFYAAGQLQKGKGMVSQLIELQAYLF